MAQTEPVHIGEDRLVIHNLVKRDPSAGFAEDVRKGLSSEPKRLLPKYFYDELGSLLFDAICLLPEYYLTRAENEIIERYADEIVSSVDGHTTLLEMGSGSASKTKLIVQALLNKQTDLLFIPVDISASALDSSSRILLQSFPRLRIEAYAADYFDSLSALSTKKRGRQMSSRPKPNPKVSKPMSSSATLPASTSRSAKIFLAVLLLTGHNSPAGLVEVGVVGPAVQRGEPLGAVTGATPAVLDPVGAGGVPAHPDEQRAVVAVVGRPPVLRRRHHLDDVPLQRVDVELLELLGVVEVRVHRVDPRRVLVEDLTGRAGSATSPGWCCGRRRLGSGASMTGFSLSLPSWVTLVPFGHAVSSFERFRVGSGGRDRWGTGPSR